MMDARKRKIVLGLGNILLKDEGLGVHALHVLQAALADVPEPGFQDIELLDGGTLGLSLLPIVEDASHLLVLDAVDAGRPPGTLIELEEDSISQFGNMQLSLHQLSFQTFRGSRHYFFTEFQAVSTALARVTSSGRAADTCGLRSRPTETSAGCAPIRCMCMGR